MSYWRPPIGTELGFTKIARGFGAFLGPGSLIWTINVNTGIINPPPGPNSSYYGDIGFTWCFPYCSLGRTGPNGSDNVYSEVVIWNIISDVEFQIRVHTSSINSWGTWMYWLAVGY